MINPFKILFNRFRCFFDSIGFFKKQTRIKTNFEVGDYQFYVDMICGVPKIEYLPEKSLEYRIKRMIDQQIDKLEKSYPNIDRYFNYISRDNDQKSLKSGVEILISDLRGVTIFINKLEVKSKSDIRDEIISKVLK